MNECLNSDDEDEENHRELFCSFEYPHRKSCADANIRGDVREYSLITQDPLFISPAYDKRLRSITPFLNYWKYNGLIT
jgi:hypothetical protein